MIIREATENELPVIKEHRVTAYEEYAKLLPESHWLALKSAITADIDTLSGAELLIAEEGGRILGSVALFPAKTDAYQGYVKAQDYPEIRMLAIMPDARKRGVGSALIKDCIARSRGRNAKYIGLHTGEFMTGAMRLYEKIGFHRVCELDFVPAHDGIVVKAYRYQIQE
ncbi:GNAT family N-acetyltransferase [Bacillus sp. JJ1122]|uniref:GNAT family N-acetyltransferase n=1 Tax=Bacillus sp. JJ1122 TaxID=3122951 RepID=UPI002FFF708A